MTRHALIIRSDYDAVAGVHNSAECIGQVLRGRGFALTLCEGPAATRGGILAAYDHLIERAQPEDAVVVYYAGHGGLATHRSYTPGSPLPPYVQHLCPADFADTRDDDFRGICALELSLKLAALTQKTANATVILECCFAAQMSRSTGDEPDGAPVARPKLTRVGLTRHLEEVRARARALGVAPGAGSPQAVRVVASGQTELARRVSLPSDEVLRALGIASSRHDEWIGALTLGLVQILAEIGEARVPWRSIAPVLRARLLVQRPEIEGAISRVPFSLDTVESAAFRVRRDGDGAVVEAGQLLGVSLGDVYRVVPAGATDGDRAAVVATVTIDEVSPLRARGSRIVWADGHRELPVNATAIASSLATERWLRALPEDGGIAPAAVTLELGQLEPAGPFRPIARHGEPMELHGAFVMKLENTTGAPLYANMFHIGSQGRIALLSDAWTSGVPLLPGQPVFVGDTSHGELRGFDLSWPDGAPRDRPQRETVMAMITTEPADLRALDSESHLGRTRSAPPEMPSTFARGVPRGGRTPARYTILWRDVLRYPQDGSRAFGSSRGPA